MGLFRAAYGWEGKGAKKPPSLKSVTYVLQEWNLAQLYFTWRRSKKYVNHVTHPLSSADFRIFLLEISKFCYFKKYRYRLYFDTLFLIFLTFFESWKIFLINMFIILMMSAKMATLGLLKKKVMTSWFLSMTSSTQIYHVTQIILYMLSRDQSLVTLVLLWDKLS